MAVAIVTGIALDTDRYTHALELAEDLLADVELSRTPVGQQVLKANRLARLVGDEGAQTWLKFELGGIPDTDQGRYHMTTTRRWTDQEQNKGYWAPITDLESTATSLRQQLEASKVDSFSGDMMYPTSRDHRTYQSGLSSSISRCEKVVSRVRTHVHNFVSETYHELLFSERQRAVFESAREGIDRLLAPTVGDALEKIDSIYRRLDEGDREAISQAMNTCRRLINSFADSIFPPRQGTVEVGGSQLQVGPNHAQNRINAFVAEKVVSRTRRDRLRRALSDIYDRVSTGVHDEVTFAEARFLFLNTYVLLGEILALGADSRVADSEGERQ